jgi:flagellum-specific peptidoglycan hydrolase FlgJ
MTGFSVAHGTVADLTSPSSVPVKLLALNKPAGSPAAGDSALRAAIVKAARYYLGLAQSRSPAAMEALIWQNDSIDGVDHGESCAAFASLTLESGAQATGQQSWVTGGSTYPWPVHSWVDSRVDPNPDSLGVTSILQDAQAHNRWHPLGDGYTPQPGDWVLFDGHVEVVTRYAGGVLYTIGGDSMPNMSVNAHEYDGPLAAQGVTGFVNNGVLLSAVSQASGGAQGRSAAAGEAAQGGSSTAQSQPVQGQADIPGTAMPALSLAGTAQSGGQLQAAPSAAVGSAAGPGAAAAGTAAAGTAAGGTAITATATIPGAVPIAGSVISYSSVIPSARYSRSQAAPSTASAPDTSAQQAFIAEVAPGALAAQHQYGIPAAVTIAQAIDESGWGRSMLAAQDNNLFGIKGTGPAGSVERPTQEYENGQAVTVNAPFRVYSNVAQSITDHSLLLATGSAYQQAMADRRSPDAFANDLTGVYATDPNYGANLITIMRQFNLYRFDAGTSAAHGTATVSRSVAGSGSGQSGAAQGGVARTGSAPSAAGHGGTGRSGSTQGGSGQGGVARTGTASNGAAGSGSVQNGAAGSGSGQNGAGQNGAGQSTVEGSESVAGGAVAGQLGQALSGTAAEGSGGASIPGLDVYAGTPAQSSAAVASGSAAAATAATSAHLEPAGGQALQAGPRNLHVSTRRYVTQMPRVVLTDFITTAKIPLLRAKPVYQQVAEDHGVRWELLAACDWTQCQARPGVSPVFGEDLGTKNHDGTVYRTKTDALEQCVADLIELAAVVYGIDLRQRRLLSVPELANVFAAFRWGGLLKAHRISAMDFPYSVEGLTAAHMKMRWPDIGGDAPDKPGTRFRMSFGAVPVVLRLNYPAVA